MRDNAVINVEITKPNVSSTRRGHVGSRVEHAEGKRWLCLLPAARRHLCCAADSRHRCCSRQLPAALRTAVFAACLPAPCHPSHAAGALHAQDDVALYYSVAVDYYSGRSNTPSSLSGALAGTRLLACGRTGQEAFTDASVARTAGNSLAVRCPKDCASQAGPVYNDGSYLAASSVCRAAIHAGVITSAAGGAFRVTLRTPGSRATWQTSACTGCVCGCGARRAQLHCWAGVL